MLFCPIHVTVIYSSSIYSSFKYWPLNVGTLIFLHSCQKQCAKICPIHTKGPEKKKIDPLLEGTEDKSHSATYKGNTKVKIFHSLHV